MLDPGHGTGSTHNRGSLIGNEGDNNWEFAQVLKKELEKYGIKVGTTRPNKASDPGLSARGQMAKGYDLFISLHSNASGNASVRGVEIFPDTNPVVDDHQLADNLCKAIAGVGTPNRGVRYWSLSPEKYQTGLTKAPKLSNYFAVLRSNLASRYAMLVEFVYHTNKTDCQLYVNKRQELAEATAKTIASYYGLAKANNTYKTKTPIANQKPTVSIEQMKEWARVKKANKLFIDLTETFYNVALGRNLDPALLYAQSAKETAYMNFGGVLDASFNNPCGLKTHTGGGNYDPNAHQRFKNWEQGIKAQADHLNLYAGADGYPMKDSPDPRHFPSIKGTAKTVEELGGKWAGARNYGTSIVDRMEEIKTIKTKEVEKLREDKKPSYKYAIAYANDGDLSNAQALLNVMPTNSILIKTTDAEGLNVEKAIQVGGATVKGADIVLAGANRKLTLDEINTWIRENL